MKTKVKRFSHKLLALFMAIIMGITCFSGVFSAYAASADTKYHDGDVEYNNLAWSVLSDEQTATALLDYLDDLLAEFGPQIDNMLEGALPSSGVYYYSPSERAIKISAVVINASVSVKLHSVDELLETLESAESTIREFSGVIGDAGNIQLSSTNGMRRSNTSSCDILKGILGILQKNSADYNGKDVLGEFLRGGFDLGTLGGFVDLDIYGLIGGLLGCDDGYESKFVYNVVQTLIFENTNWFTEDEKAAYKADPSSFVFDEVLLEKMTDVFLQEINAEITYKGGSLDGNTVSSKDRYQAILDKVESDGVTFKEAATQLGYDPEIVYTDDGNVRLFVYGTNDDGTVAETADKIHLDTNSTLFTFGYEALRLAWETALKDTVSTIRVNYNVDRGHGSNFDNTYYYWAKDNIPGGWDVNNLVEMYSPENINNWATAVYADYSAESPEEFLGWVKDNYDFDRTAAEDSTGSWADIDETTLFNKLRYSPLADYGFNMETGPINLYIMQTGADNLETFFESYGSYNSLVAGLNNALVAAVKDLFVDNADRPNVYGDKNLPVLQTVNPTTIDNTAIVAITNTLVSNALAVVQYTADATDSNILKAFYDNHTASAKLTESNLEEAMIPLLIACIGQINLNGYKLEDYIHPEDWDACKDAEAVIFVVLREYLSFILPAKNYNSLAEGVADDGSLTGDTIEATLDGTILPMARDAVVYVMQGYVPVTGDDGNEYDVYSNPVDDTTDIFELLNSVICYYGGEYPFEDSSIPKSVGAMGVGALLGVCDNNGRSLITDSNDLWTNIDLVANHLMPVLGTLQYGDAGKYGDFSSEELIYNDIVKGVLDIGDNSLHTSGMYGVSNFIYRLLTIVSAAPIQSTPVTLTVYDLVADFINALFGARYDAQGWTEVIPARTSSHPFDDVLQNKVVVGTDGSDVGIIQKLICNFVEFCGYSTNGVNSYPDSILRGLMFAIQAVQSFVPSILGSIGEHQLQMGTANYDQRVVEGCTSGGQYNTTVSFKNNSTGVNKAYVDGINGTVEQLQRYYMKVKSASVVSSTGSNCSVTGINSNYAVAPGETVKFNATSVYTPDSNSATTVAATITYDICLSDGTVLYQNLETTAYQYLTGAQGWESNVYPDGGTSLNAEFGREDRNQTRTVGGYNIYSSNWFRGEKLFVDYPEYMVITTSSLDSINKYQFRVQNLDTGFGSEYGFDGFFCYDNKTVANDYPNGGGTVTVNRLNAIPIYDKETGDILKYGLYDVSYDGGESWDRGSNNAGYDQEGVNNAITSHPGIAVKTRDHVVYTLQEAISAGIVAAYHQNAAGVIEYLYLKAGSGQYAYDTLLGQISLKGPVDGIYINQGKMTIPKGGLFSGYGSAETTSLFVYDGETKIQAGDYEVNLTAYTSNSSNNVGDGLTGTGAGSGILNGPGGCTLVVGDDSSASSLDTSYNNLSKILANYRDEDFSDPTAKTLAENALLNALSVQASVITPTTAHQLSDNTYLGSVKKTVATEYGDMAYKPFTEANASELQMPINVLAEAYTKNGIYYYDEACTMPIYSNVRLESTDVVDGKDPAGMPVIEGTGDDAGSYWLRNEPSYEKQWNTTAYDTPWREYVIKDGQKVQATNDNGDLLYEQVNYVYRDSRGDKVNSDNPEWRAKFPETEYQCIENTGSGEDNRGLYTQAADYLAYVEEYVYGAIDTSIANDLFTEISLVRNSLNNNNFEVVTYNKMVDFAKLVESNYTINIPYTYEETVLDEETGEPVLDGEGNAQTQTVSKVDEISFSQYNDYINNPDITVDTDAITTSSTLSSVQVAEYVREFDIYMNKVVERGYNGDQLEQEIKCASGSDYSAMTAVAPSTSEEGETVNGSVKFNSADTSVPYGALDESGNLVNEGPVVYEDTLWNNYVNSLASAVSIAAEGNGDYAHKTSTYYQPDQKDAYTCQVTDCYTADTDLQAAEIALETAAQINVAYNEGGYVTVDGVQIDTQKPYAVDKDSTVTLAGVANEGYDFNGFVEENIYTEETEEGTVEYKLYADADSMTVTPVFETTAPTGFNVTASLVVSKNSNGETDDVAVNGNYTITLYKQGTQEVVGEPYTFASAKDANSFTLTAVPAGTYDMVITSDYSIERTVTLVVTDHDITGPAISVIACDYTQDGAVGSDDAITIYQQMAGNNELYCDLNGDGAIGSDDAIVVYSCMAAGSMPSVTIQ